MTKVRTIKLIGPALDWAVMLCEHEGRAEGWLKTYLAGGDKRFVQNITDSPSTNWDQGGPIIEREGICLTKYTHLDPDHHDWSATIMNSDGSEKRGPHNCLITQLEVESPLVAAMRCYVSYKLGDIIEIPDQLIEEQ